MILLLTFLTGFTSKTVSVIATWLILVAFFAIFYPLGYTEVICVYFLASPFYKYKVLLLYPLKIFVIYTSVMVMILKISHLSSSLVTSREVFVRFCYFECIYFIFISLFSS